MYYFSTRDKNIQSSASNAIIQGLSQDGGLFVCDLQSIHIDVASLLNASYQEMAYTILKPFLPTFTEPKLKACIRNAYTNTFSSDDVTPLVKLDEREFILELFHGPTAAFKDVALSLLPYLLLKSKEIENDVTKSLILTATSGDTGKAALEGFKNVDNTKIMVFYPLDGVSAVQERQMNTTLGSNTKVIGIHGNFDDAQNAVKIAFNSSELQAYAKEHNYVLSSANSINIGRLLPQIVYYFYSYVTLLKNKEIYLGEEINFSVPTGNFGDIFAGYIAKSIGLPIHTLICGSNDNNVLFEFLSTGHYNRKKELIKTISPSMDILVSSNLERLLYYVSKDTDYVKELMEQLKEKGEYVLKQEYLECIQKDFYPSFASTKETKQIIHDVYHSYSYVLDPHSAVAYKANKDYVLDTQDKRKCVILSTASPCKFTDAVLDALHIEPSSSSFDNIHVLSEQTNVEIPKNLRNIDKLEIRHNNKIEKADILNVIKDYMNE